MNPFQAFRGRVRISPTVSHSSSLISWTVTGSYPSVRIVERSGARRARAHPCDIGQPENTDCVHLLRNIATFGDNIHAVRVRDGVRVTSRTPAEPIWWLAPTWILSWLSYVTGLFVNTGNICFYVPTVSPLCPYWIVTSS